MDSSGNTEQELFNKDLDNGWNQSVKSPWDDSVHHSTELYDLHEVGSVKNVLCIRLFACSLYEIAESSKEPYKMMDVIFGENFIRSIAKTDKQIYESITQTIQHLIWRIRKSQILIFRRTSERHDWSSVREILTQILANDKKENDETEVDNKKIVVGMCASIIQDIFRCHVQKSSFREDGSLLPTQRFHDVLRVSLFLFNDSIGEYIFDGKKEVVYELLASRLVVFYTRLVADTWRILVVRNGPKAETEWYMISNVEDTSKESLNKKKDKSRAKGISALPKPTQSSNDQNNNKTPPPQNPYPNQKPLRKP